MINEFLILKDFYHNFKNYSLVDKDNYKSISVLPILKFTITIRYSVDNDEFGCCIFIDFKKAFDTVNHSILLIKFNALYHYGAEG